MHEDITNRKTFEQVTASPEVFKQLVGMVLLFSRDSKWFEYSGWCRGAVLDATCPCCDKRFTMLAFSKGPEATKPEDMMKLELSREELILMLSSCDAFIGQSSSESFLLDWTRS